MGAIDTNYTFTATDVITSTKMNNILDQSTITATAIIGTTLAVTTGKLSVAAGGIRANELAVNAVTTTAILDANVTPAKLSNSDFGAFTVASGVATLDADVVTTAKILDANVTAAKILDANITAPKLNGAQTGTAPIFGVRAWVNFNAQSAANIGGTYTRTASTTVTVDTSSDHDLIVGNAVYLDFTVGTGTAPFDGLYVVASVVDSNTFTVVSSTTTTSTGTISLSRKTIRASGNVANVSAAYSGATIASSPASNQAADAGFYVVNFTTAMPDANAAISGVCNQSGNLDVSSGNDFVGGFTPNEKCAFISTISVASNGLDCLHTSVQIIR
jgi:hypothetical protein